MELQRTHACAPVTTRGRGLLLSGNGADTLCYANGKSVFTLNVCTRAVETYQEHAAACTAARFSQCGKLLCTGDAAGGARLWALGAAKSQLQVSALAGAVNDVALSRDLKTLYVCGEGRGRLACAFNADTGALLGALSGLARPANSLDLSGDGLRVATGDDGGTVHAHDSGAPFKPRLSVQDQGGRAVNCVRFAPTSSAFVTAGGRALLLYSGDGVAPTELLGHTGSIYCCSWRPDDGAQILTAGADKTVRLFDATAAREVSRFSAGDTLDDTQVGCVWLGQQTLASVALSGDIMLFDPRLAGCHTRFMAHQRSVTAMASGSRDGSRAEEAVWTADYSGRVLSWSPDTGCTGRMPPAHTNSVVGAAVRGKQLVSCGLDDQAWWRSSDPGGAAEGARSVKLPCAPKTMSVSAGGLAALATVAGMTLARDGAVLASAQVAGAAAAAITGSGSEVAVGCAGGAIHLFAVSADGSQLKEAGVLSKHRDTVTALQFDASGARLASCDAAREVVVWDRDAAAPHWAPKASLGRMLYHTARVLCLAWSPDGKRLASGGLDCSIIVWDMEQPASKRVTIAGAHRESVAALCWANGRLVSAGADACIRVWA